MGPTHGVYRRCAPLAGFLLGAHAPLDELRGVFATQCPMVLFSSARDLTRSDVLYHPGQTFKFAHKPPFKCTDPPFRHNSPDSVQQLISSSVNTHAADAPANRERLALNPVEADLHFPLFCTPYYGFVPGSEVDLLVEILQLSSFLCTCCFSADGKDLPQLGDSIPTAAALLSTLSAIPNERPGGSLDVFPGTGVFICGPAPAPQDGEPAIACWLYTPARLPPPPPKAFTNLISISMLVSCLPPFLASRRPCLSCLPRKEDWARHNIAIHSRTVADRNP